MHLNKCVVCRICYEKFLMSSSEARCRTRDNRSARDDLRKLSGSPPLQILITSVVLTAMFFVTFHVYVVRKERHYVAIKASIQVSRGGASGVNKERFIVVNGGQNFTSRLHEFNAVLSRFRGSILSNERFVSPLDFQLAERQSVVQINGDGYLSLLSRYPHITTLQLPWRKVSRGTWTSLNDDVNLLMQRYYPWTGSDPFCDWLKHNTRLMQLYVKLFRKMHCNRNLTKTSSVTSVGFGHMKANTAPVFPPSFYTEPPRWLLYLHVLAEDTIVTTRGSLISGDLKLVSDYCRRNHDPEKIPLQVVTASSLHDELFTILHPPGHGVFHEMLEELPRLAPFVEFLKDHPHIPIHISNGKHAADFMRVLGLNTSRAVTGLVRARLVYVPRLASCMMPRFTETQILAEYSRRYVHENFPARTRNSLLMIQRSGNRRFDYWRPVNRRIKEAATEYGLDYVVFADDPLPSFNETTRMFQSAVMVVAVHGAGLSNILFCEPGTYVIEIVPNSAVTPFCYLQLAHILGHRWHAVPTETRSWHVVEIDSGLIVSAVRRYLEIIRPKRKT